MTGARRVAGAALATAAVVLALAPQAAATLRATKLESTCTSGYTYGEYTFGNWTVEGCSKSAALYADDVARRLFRGNIEVNGMVFEISDSGPDLTAAEEDNGSSANTGNLKRTTSTTIVFDPLVDGARKRFVIYTGAIDMTTTEAKTVDTPAEQAASAPPSFGNLVHSSKTASVARRSENVKARAAAEPGIATDYVDIPTNDSAKLFGLAIQNGIKDAGVRPQNGAIAASTVFDAELALGTTGASDLLNVQGSEEITLTDGSGMQAANLKLNFPDIEVPGIGGLEDFFIEYDGDVDSWKGGLDLDLGSLFPEIEFEAEVSASDGKLLYIKTDASNLPPIPIGATGIILDSVRFEFGLDPLLIAAGASATAGPTIGGSALILLDGDVRMEFEPSFRLEVTGGARVLPTGSGELASGGFEFIYDADGLISLSGDARFEAAISGVGIGAQITGSGAYSTTSNRFNIEATATGSLLLGFIGDFEVARLEAVVSSNGFGTCGKLLSFVSGGIGQVWGRKFTVFTGCDLGAYDAPVGAAVARVSQGGERVRQFQIPQGAKQVGIEVTTDRPDPKVILRAPDGSTRVVTAPGDRREADADTVVLTRPGVNQVFIGLRNPPAGRWAVGSRAEDPQVTGVRIARDVPEIEATAAVDDPAGDRAGRRRVTVKRTGRLAPGEELQYAIRTKKGLHELGAPTAAESVRFSYDESDAGDHEIVAFRVREGIPIASGKKVIGRYKARFPGRPVSIRKKRRGTRLTVRAKVRRGAEAPDAWQYTFDAGRGRKVVHRGKVGRALTITVPRRIKKVKVTARPVVRGRAVR